MAHRMVNGIAVEMTAEEEAAHLADQAVLHAENLARMAERKRREELPPLQEQIDALLAGGKVADDMRARVAAVKR